MKFAGRFLLSVAFGLSCSSFLVGQQPKRVLWTEENSCRSMGFTTEEQSELNASCDHWVANDGTIQIIQIGELAVTVIIGDDGDYILADTYITNKSDQRILADPYQSILFAWKTADFSGTAERLVPISGQEITSKLKRRARWINVLDAVLSSFARNTTTIQSNTSGSIDLNGLGSGGFFTASGSYSGTTTTTISTPDLLARIQSDARIRARDENAANKSNYYVSNAMKANTVFAKESVSGLIYFKRKKAPAAVFTIRIGDILFDFPSPRPTASGVAARRPTVPIPVPEVGFLSGTQKSRPPGAQPLGPPPIAGSSASTASPGETRTSPSGIEMVWVPSGKFTMGSSDGDRSERPTREVTITEGFWMGKYEVTQIQWFTAIGLNPSGFSKCGGNCPVENVSWEDAQRFISKLNANNDGFIYRLPTEAEWEYAANAGAANTSFGNLKDSAWYNQNSDGRTRPVGTKLPNAFGLFDMSGNVWEWCEDWYNEKPPTPLTDPKGPTQGKERALRGGAYNYESRFLRSSYRGRLSPTTKHKHVGLRLVAKTR